MMHERRIWSVTTIESAEELARKLTESTWTLCTAFEHRGHLFLNDATSEDSAQEYAVVKRLGDGTFLQVESITFGWCSFDRALGYVLHATGGRDDGGDFATHVNPRLETADQHRRCPLCG
ncbi:hypothetical protein [Tautonia sociabilis]|uniref:Uncharacterized protein n=1 Tax=Tautonia sociabilis TaxID=2080755 RepID=A0A432MF04_9BACT|nr:hypothetical protein [Tautonia sociabilis]RUL84360.1 hypothetical protein TsocGM_20320 [Tautonia sociabilis]